MSFYRTIILLTVLALCSFHSMGQDTNYVYQDTALLYQDSVAAKLKEVVAPVAEDDSDTEGDYTGDTILRQNELFVESDSIKKLKSSESFAYAKNLDSLLYDYQQRQKKNQAAEKEDISWFVRLLLSPITKYFMLIVAVIFIIFILYKLFFTEGFFQRPHTAINVAALPEEDDNLSVAADYGKLIAQAISSHNYRMAVRYHYLQSLQRLSSKGAIQFAVDKTNFQYVRELSGKKYKNSFASLTLDYEYVWYGGFEIDERIFNSIQNKFKLFNSEV